MILPNENKKLYRNAINNMRDVLILKNYSHNTQKTYLYMLTKFLKYIYPKSIHQITFEDIKSYHLQLVNSEKKSTSYQNQSINAIKFYLEKILKYPKVKIELERPRKEKKLPIILSKNEVSKIIGSINNPKHKSIIMVIYSSGLRISECINLQIKDIDSDNMRIWIKQSKGNKDRLTILSPKVLFQLRNYYMLYKPKKWLFESPKGNQYSSSSIRSIFKNAKKKAKINSPATVHSLRHSFATHLLENGTNLRYIQKLLGHNSSKTTEIYTHVCNSVLVKIESPFDSIDN